MNEFVKVSRTSAAAIWSLVLGILSLICFGFMTGIPAIICGHVSRSEIRKSQGALEGNGMALAGLITGYVGLVFTTIGVLAAIAVPNFIAYRDKAFCSRVEMEAHGAAAYVADYFADPSRETIPTAADLASDGYVTAENVTVYIGGDYDQLKITATDDSGRCPWGSQFVLSVPEDRDDGWQ